MWVAASNSPGFELRTRLANAWTDIPWALAFLVKRPLCSGLMCILDGLLIIGLLGEKEICTRGKRIQLLLGQVAKILHG